MGCKAGLLERTGLCYVLCASCSVQATLLERTEGFDLSMEAAACPVANDIINSSVGFEGGQRADVWILQPGGCKPLLAGHGENKNACLKRMNCHALLFPCCLLEYYSRAAAYVIGGVVFVVKCWAEAGKAQFMFIALKP